MGGACYTDLLSFLRVTVGGACCIDLLSFLRESGWCVLIDLLSFLRVSMGVRVTLIYFLS